ncbi:MAG TPA: transferase [Desulfocapsa sulfexigens]|nr:transferase [Desulfocapsa sulfexigens]
MKALSELYNRIIQRVNINLREFNFDVEPFIHNLVPFDQLAKVHGFYAVTAQHPLDFQFRHSNLAGSYLLGKCRTTNSILYKSDIRGDELKKKGSIFHCDNFKIPLTKEEGIRIENSFLIKTLVHNYSHDPESPERFSISNTVSTHYANIHGSPTDGSFLGPFATVDLSTINDCVIGAFSYVQAGEINHFHIDPGTVWVRSPGDFNFLFRYPADILGRYIQFRPGSQPDGILIDFVNDHKNAFERIFETVNIKSSIAVPPNASLDRFAVVQPKLSIEDNVLVAQRSFLQNSHLGRGANAQENCFIINSFLKGFNVTAHGAKLINVDLEEMVFVGFNSFLRGNSCRLGIGRDCIIMPHTIIDIQESLLIPAGCLVWGSVTCQADLETNSIPLKTLEKLEDGFSRKNLVFEGNGKKFVSAFQNRIQHILEANGAFYNGKDHKGHAQKNQNISFNIIQPYSEGEKEGVYPTIIIRP